MTCRPKISRLYPSNRYVCLAHSRRNRELLIVGKQLLAEIIKKVIERTSVIWIFVTPVGRIAKRYETDEFLEKQRATKTAVRPSF